MKIKLVRDLPVGPEHGMTKDRVLEVIKSVKGAGRGQHGWWVEGDAGEEVRVFTHEAKVVGEGDADDSVRGVAEGVPSCT